ncbi:hypothetical protein VCRA2110O3_90114 [Vibrio crassostreae]|nr:hypothetical protein VCRA2114E5_110057 [Vibrio crassostreae]CAK2185896.1 hypothetical protein VCRA2110O4_90057 [Vibrio crassostreae]CAK2669832.1 hypothetical protein VCRA2127O15_110115 [Vibrio crassostreae]CAK2744294.1 hypothetical protein VCRA2122O10_210016 [Vibrio crassostreae]CAK2986203.1 hypothetical protein VCRA2110O3_90114 [Vibrio crassostreae]
MTTSVRSNFATQPKHSDYLPNNQSQLLIKSLKHCFIRISFLK